MVYDDWDKEYYFAYENGIYKKLGYYSECIKEAFNTTGWEDVAVWEILLQENRKDA